VLLYGIIYVESYLTEHLCTTFSGASFAIFLEDQIPSTEAIIAGLNNIRREYAGLPGPDLYFCTTSPTAMLATTATARLQICSFGMSSITSRGNSQDYPILSPRITIPYKYRAYIITKE